MPSLLKIITAILLLSFTAGCGATPKEVDRDGLRQRADEETSKVR
jgi:hypothetical protein